MSDDTGLPSGWMVALLHPAEDAFQPEGHDTEYCRFCYMPVLHPFHREEAALDEEGREIALKYFQAMRNTVKAEQELNRVGIELGGNDLELGRLSFLVEMLLAGSLKPVERVYMETGWTEHYGKLCKDALAAYNRARTSVASQNLIVPQNSGSLIVPGDPTFRKEA